MSNCTLNNTILRREDERILYFGSLSFMDYASDVTHHIGVFEHSIVLNQGKVAKIIIHNIDESRKTEKVLRANSNDVELKFRVSTVNESEILSDVAREYTIITNNFRFVGNIDQPFDIEIPLYDGKGMGVRGFKIKEVVRN